MRKRGELAPIGETVSGLDDVSAIQGSDQIAVEIQHKDPFLADKGAIEHVLGRTGQRCPIRSG